MVSGHVGIAFAFRGARRGARRDASLVALLVAAILPDIVDMGYAAVGFCSPAGLYSHSLPAIGILAAAAFVATLAWTRNMGVALVMAAVVLVHVPADWFTGFKYLWAHGPIVGLVLYDHPLIDFLLEAPIVVAGWMLLRRDPRAPRWATTVATLALLISAQAVFDAVKTTGAPEKPSGCDARRRR